MLDRPRQNSCYDVAQVCANGHVVTSSLKSRPIHSQKFCDNCGEPTITKCEHCSTEIRGDYHVPEVIGIFSYIPPSFCYNCGKPFTWTERKLAAAKELTDELEELSKEEKTSLKKSLDELVKDTPNTKVAETRFKRLIKKAGSDAYEGMKSIMIEIVSETVKKSLFGS